MIKLKEMISEQDNTIGKKEWSKVEKVITRGMDMVFERLRKVKSTTSRKENVR